MEELKDWMEKESIVKDDGNKYAQSSINAILSNSDSKNSPTSNKNRKVLQSRMIKGGIYEYWLAGFGGIGLLLVEKYESLLFL